jgi:hypothetical protein
MPSDSTIVDADQELGKSICVYIGKAGRGSCSMDEVSNGIGDFEQWF